MQISGANIINHQSDTSYRFERINAARLGHMAQLYEAVYDKKIPVEYYTRKYNTAYTGVMYTGYLAYNDSGLPVAYYGVIPCFIQYDNRLILAAQSADTMTHPAHRNKGLFIILANLTFELCQIEGICLIYGFPNQNSLPGLLKLGWQIIDTLECFTVPVKTIPLARIVKKLGLFRNLYNSYCKKILKRYQLPQKGIPNLFDGVYRDHQYLQYKSYNDTFTIQISGALVWFKIQDRFVIGDMIGFENNAENVLNDLVKLSRKLGLNALQFQASPNTALHAALKKHYQPVPAFPVMIKDLGSGITPDKLKFTFADIDIF
jgi:hypothetical protein